MPSLFPEPSQPRTKPLGNAEPAVHWLTESTWPEAVASRAAINDWYLSFPDVDGNFAARLRSEVDADHYQSIDELFLYSRLTAGGLDVRYEEDGRGPDFRLYRAGDLVGAIEVASLFQRRDWTDEERRSAVIADAINERLHPNLGFFLTFDIARLERTPSIRRLCRFLREHMTHLADSGAGASTGERVGLARVPQARFEEDGVDLEFSFVPVAPDAQSRSNPDARIVAGGPIIGGMVNSAERLRKVIGAKAGGRYDIGDAPFCVAVGIHDTLCGVDEIEAALYGGEVVELDLHSSRTEFTRGNDGLFGRDRERPDGRHRRLSAAVTITNLNPWNQPGIATVTAHNPFPLHAWPDDLLPSREYIGWRVTPGRSTFGRY
jgi:hypothetical protein